MTLEELEKLSDSDLAAHHSGWKPHSEHELLCRFEWQRRAQVHSYRLAEKISQRERAATLIGVAVGAATTMLGVFLTNWVSK